jgi:putative ABC transport system ATP-binding protein
MQHERRNICPEVSMNTSLHASTPTENRPIIHLDKVTKIYGTGQVRVPALQEVSFDIMPGEFIVLLGPSGSGKTTLLNLIGGLDSITSGYLEVNGTVLEKLPEAKMTQFRRCNVGFIFQFFNLIPTLTARENIEFAAELVKHPLPPDDLLHEVGLGDREDHFPSELSGGENQRVPIARALAPDPPIVLCDEPTGSLDFETGKKIYKLLCTLNSTRRKTILVVTHNSAVGEIAHRVIRLRDGKILEICTNKEPVDPDNLKW